MRALVKGTAGPGGLELVERPDPVPGPGQVRLAVGAVGLCGTDVHIVRGEWPVPVPIVLGHEIAGVVCALGPGVRGVRMGDRVTTETDAFVCGRCRFCRRGDQHLCPRRRAVGTTSDGGLADFVVVPARGVHALPPGVSLVDGALVEPLAVAVHAVIERGGAEVALRGEAAAGPRAGVAGPRGRIAAGARVVVVGPGTIGLLAAQVARAVGAEVTVAGLARHGSRFALARRLGCRRVLVLDAASPPARFDVAIECSGSPDGLAAALRLVPKGGSVIAVGLFGRHDVAVDMDAVVNRELTLVATRGKRPSSFRVGLELLAAGAVRLGPLVTHRFPLECWAEAFETAGTPGTKVVVLVGQGS